MPNASLQEPRRYVSPLSLGRGRLVKIDQSRQRTLARRQQDCKGDMSRRHQSRTGWAPQSQDPLLKLLSAPLGNAINVLLYLADFE